MIAKRIKPWLAFGALALAGSVLASCSSERTGEPQNALLPSAEAVAAVKSPRSPFGTYIKHVVIIIQENRSFENMFAGWPGADAPMYGYTKTNGRRKKISLQPVGFIARDINHQWRDAMAGWDNGKMDGFSNNMSGPLPAGTFPYSYLKHSAITPYRTMAKQYVLADHMFSTMFSSSFIAHLDLIASTTNINPNRAIVNVPTRAPWGCDAPAGTLTSLIGPAREVLYNRGPFPCFSSFRTLSDTLDASGVSWKYYAPNIITSNGHSWSAFDAIKRVRYGPDWSNVISPQTRVLTDAAAGALPSVTWVTPDSVDSDHPANGRKTGPSWVAGVVNAIGQGPDWNSTAIVLLWDDWGGWYDNVPPPQLDFKGLGMRVPCIVISPYAKKNYVSHTQYEFGSVIKLVEDTFGLPPLGSSAAGYTDSRANDFDDAFDFAQSPRAFVKIAAPYPPAYFIKRAPSLQLPDND
jgi:phospholipase C